MVRDTFFEDFTNYIGLKPSDSDDKFVVKTNFTITNSTSQFKWDAISKTFTTQPLMTPSLKSVKTEQNIIDLSDKLDIYESDSSVECIDVEKILPQKRTKPVYNSEKQQSKQPAPLSTVKEGSGNKRVK